MDLRYILICKLKLFHYHILIKAIYKRYIAPFLESHCCTSTNIYCNTECSKCIVHLSKYSAVQ